MALVLAALTFATFRAVPGHDFVDWDDGLYVTANPHTQAGLEGEQLLWALTSLEPFNWHPLTLWSHMLDVELYGLNPEGHHLSSLILHVAAVLILFGMLRSATGSVWRSGLASALFAIHPQHVESVAWVAERKDVLSALFWFLTMWAYIGFVRDRSLGRYLTIVACFALGLMAKSMLVTLPLILLLFDFWPLGRLEISRSPMNRRRLARCVVEKVPLLLLAGAVSVVTVVAQSGAISPVDTVPFGLRTANAAVSYLAYLVKTAVPSGLAMFYPLPEQIPVGKFAGSVALLILASVVVVWRARTAPHWVTGWFWYLVTLLPVIGLVQVGSQARADRYTYIPLVGIFIGVAWALGILAERLPTWRSAVAGAAVVWVALLAVVAHRQAAYWSDSVTLFRRAVVVTENNRLAHLNLAEALSDRGDRAALEHYRAAIAIAPEWADAHAALGESLRQWGRSREAVSVLERAVELSPNDPKIYFSLARSQSAAGLQDEALARLERVLELDPEFAGAYQGRGVILEQRGEWALALDSYRRALEIDSTRTELVERIERLVAVLSGRDGSRPLDD
jgi:cytochrome c-type biogenesis protein CcmH/NrfG